MPRYLIEVPHESQKAECLRAVKIFNETGSHFLTNADWGCSDEVHKAWVVVEVENKEQANLIVPPSFRDNATVVELQKFEFDNPKEGIEFHKG